MKSQKEENALEKEEKLLTQTFKRIVRQFSVGVQVQATKVRPRKKSKDDTQKAAD